MNEEDTAAARINRFINDDISSKHQSLFWGDRLLSLDKSAGFLSDPDFFSAFKSIRGSHTYDQYSSPHTIAWRLHTLVWAARSGLSLEGDFVECGVFKGDMSWIITQLVDLSSTNKNFYLYDTFEGFSDKYSSPEDFPENLGFLGHANSYYKTGNLYASVCQRFINQPRVKVIKGVVPDIFAYEAPEKISFLHIDLNSPAAEVGALEVLFPRLTKSAIVIFDDYGWKLFHRQKEAEDEYMRKLGYEILELPTGQGMFVKR